MDVELTEFKHGDGVGKSVDHQEPKDDRHDQSLPCSLENFDRFRPNAAATALRIPLPAWATNQDSRPFLLRRETVAALSTKATRLASLHHFLDGTKTLRRRH
jgi:hypothetical protein